MQSQKSKLKIEIQKSNSKMGIVFINSKTKFNFPNGLRFGSAFLFCKVIITQPFGFVNRCRKFSFHAYIHTTNHIFMHIYGYKHNHIYIDTTTSIPTTTTHTLVILRVFVDRSMGLCTSFGRLSIHLPTTIYLHIHIILHMSLLMG